MHVARFVLKMEMATMLVSMPVVNEHLASFSKTVKEFCVFLLRRYFL